VNFKIKKNRDPCAGLLALDGLVVNGKRITPFIFNYEIMEIDLIRFDILANNVLIEMGITLIYFRGLMLVFFGSCKFINCLILI
jgi:hypothetical protein